MSSESASVDIPVNSPKIRTSISLSPRQFASDTSPSKFPRIEDCAHFHYESVDYGQIKLSLIEELNDGLQINGSFIFEGYKPAFCVRVTCKERTWVVRRNLAHFEKLDTLLHECVFDRRFSRLSTINEDDLQPKPLDVIHQNLQDYMLDLSVMTNIGDSGGQIFCAPVLHWLETDNHGRHLVPHALGDVADINIPAIAAARVVKRYTARDEDELNLDVGDMVSIIEMGASGWWRGKQGLRVGSFPSQCVRRINSANDIAGTQDRPFSPPQYNGPTIIRPIAKKNGKIMDFLRSFLANRPTKSQLKKKGILKERVFGCDLGELLHRTEEDVPSVVLECIKFVEEHGIVDGIYRISGVASHIRFLRYEFDSDNRPNLEKAVAGLPKTGHVPGMSKENNVVCDPHSIAGLCKLYFRELPNPLLTYQLYNRFASAVTDYEAEERLLKVHDVIQQLPPPHYRTLRHLIMHLNFMAGHDSRTSMHCRNLAIVWAPNLLRSREIEAGLAAFTEARVQSVVLEFMIVNSDLLFSDQLQTKQYDADHKPLRPRSLMVLSTPKLISLEEAQARSRTATTPTSSDNFNSSALSEKASDVRLRNSSAASRSSNDRRKRQHKKAPPTSMSAANLTQKTRGSAPPTNVKKIGHQRRASAMTAPLSSSIPENCATPSSTTRHQPNNQNGSTWKVKLGSLLRKSSTAVSRQASLRRCQSEDSLASSRSTELVQSSVTRRALNFSHASLLQAVSNEESSSLSDRRRPEPQVSCTGVEPTDEDIQAKPQRPKHVRPSGGVYSDECLEALDREAAGLPPHNSHHAENDEENRRRRNSSPFEGLDLNFPGVMGDVGLDFDPLSYKAVHGGGSAVNRVPKQSQNNSSRDRTAPPTDTTVSVRRVDSVQSLRGEAVFAAVSTSRPKANPQQGNEPKCNRTSSENGVNGNSDLDHLTADNCTSPPKSAKNDKTGYSVVRKKSAAEQLGVAQHWATKRSFHQRLTVNNNNNGAVCIAESSHLSTDDTDQGSNIADRQVDIEYYTVPQNELQKKPYYGSFVALVGKISGEHFINDSTLTQPHVVAPRNYGEQHLPSTSMDESNFYNRRPNTSQSLRCRSVTTPVQAEDNITDSEFPRWGHAQIFSPRLDTFDPSGKQRQGYEELTSNAVCKYSVPLTEYDTYAKSLHGRSRSVDSHHRSTQSSVTREAIRNTSRSIESTIPKYYPIPAPRKHYRSFSAGDHLEPQHCYYEPRKPIPLPRTKRLVSEPSRSRDSNVRDIHRPLAYSNLTYEYIGDNVAPHHYPGTSYSYNLTNQDCENLPRDPGQTYTQSAYVSEINRHRINKVCVTSGGQTTGQFRSSTITRRHATGLSWV